MNYQNLDNMKVVFRITVLQETFYFEDDHSIKITRVNTSYKFQYKINNGRKKKDNDKENSCR